MTVTTGNYLKGFYDETQALGAKAVNSDFALVIEGYEDSANWLLCKQAPWPVVAPQGEIEISGPLGMNMYQAQQVKTGQQGQVTFYETISGAMEKAIQEMYSTDTPFNCYVYEGTPDHWFRRKLLRGCFLQIDPVDRDFENRSQAMTVQGTLFFHYFGGKDFEENTGVEHYDPNM